MIRACAVPIILLSWVFGQSKAPPSGHTASPIPPWDHVVADTGDWVRVRDSQYPLTIRLPKEFQPITTYDVPSRHAWGDEQEALFRDAPDTARHSVLNHRVSDLPDNLRPETSCEARVNGKRVIIETRTRKSKRARYLMSASWEWKPGYWLNFFGMADSAALQDILIRAQYTVRFDG